MVEFEYHESVKNVTEDLSDKSSRRIGFRGASGRWTESRSL